MRARAIAAEFRKSLLKRSHFDGRLSELKRTTKGGPCHNRLLQSVIDARTCVEHLSRFSIHAENNGNEHCCLKWIASKKGGTRVKYRFITYGFFLWWTKDERNNNNFTSFMAHRIHIGHVLRILFAVVRSYRLVLAPQMCGCRENIAVESDTLCLKYLLCAHVHRAHISQLELAEHMDEFNMGKLCYDKWWFGIPCTVPRLA